MEQVWQTVSIHLSLPWPSGTIIRCMSTASVPTGSRSPATLSAAKLRHFRGLLETRRRELTHQLVGLDATLEGIRAARTDTLTDDEHDPEGPTMTFEWSRVSALRADDSTQLAAIDAALERLTEHRYGICEECGEAIAPDRLDARPATTLCIDCARLADPRR